jgi:uncharacterized protein
MLPQQVADVLLNADAKALATFSNSDINVVPVSSLKIVDGKIWLINYFLDKTLHNIIENPHASLACWKGFVGYQIKVAVTYLTEGKAFETAKAWIAEILPERTVKGLIVLEPTAIFDISASKERAGVQMS